MPKEGDLLWQPDERRIRQAEITRFMAWLAGNKGRSFTDYAGLWQWSVSDIAAFWEAFWTFRGVQSSAPYTSVLEHRHMPGARWFTGARLNYAQHALAAAARRPGDTALLYASEGQALQSLSGRELHDRVARAALALKRAGVGPGDRVVAFMPNTPDTVVAFLATASLGATWSCCAPDFGPNTVLDRFAQIEPKVLITVDGYRYGGKAFERTEVVRDIVRGLPTLKAVFLVPQLDPSAPAPVPDALDWSRLVEHGQAPALEFEQVGFDHPLWIVYSSGTTGLPKAIVHGHGGALLEISKMLNLHCDLREGSRMLFYTSSGWIMWNILASALLLGAVPVLYDGHPAAPEVDVLWRLAADSKANLFGASPTYLALMEKHGVIPGRDHDLSALEGVLLTGSPATPESMAWLYDNVKQDLWVTSQSGGTDVASGFVSGSCLLPVYAGEIQARALAVDAHAFDDDGQPVVGKVGELVITQPMPSMPVRFWNDPGDRRYTASYFEPWPGVWRHGDFFELNERGGCYIRGRSDSTLNRHGVRIGTAEVYRCVEAMDEVEDSLVVNLDLPHGRFFMPLFVRLRGGGALDDALAARIRARLKSECSPRHVPDRIVAVRAIPYTLTGKKLEVPVRRILMGQPAEKVISRDAMRDPDALDEYLALAGTFANAGS